MQLSLFPEAGFTAHRSGQDASVNWDRPADVGRIEARYVRRCADYVVVYLSAQTGCAQGCRMCHLTATGQTRLRDVTAEEIIEQAETVLEHYRTKAPPASAPLLSDADELLGELARRAVALGLRPRYLVSTILPRELGDRLLEDVFLCHNPE